MPCSRSAARPRCCGAGRSATRSRSSTRAGSPSPPPRALAALIEGFHWKEAFWSRRGELLAAMRFFAFGHALHEKALAPYVGMVAKVVFIDVDAGFLGLPAVAQVRHVDAALDAHFCDRARFRSPRLQPPLPVLGIPGWDPRTADPAFYDDTTHFRPRRR